MAVQKSRVTRSKRGMRRSHDAITAACVSVDPMTGERHRRHHIAADGYYKGEQVVQVKVAAEEEKED